MPVQLLNDYQMHYEVFGQGPPMVMIHGGLGGGEGSAAFVEHQATALSRRFRLIVYDRRAAGRSSTPDLGYSIENYAQDLHSLLEHLDVSSAHVLGSSAGGPIAMQFALNHPEMTDSLILINTMSYVQERERAVRQGELDQIQADEAELGREASTERALESRWPGLRENQPVKFQQLVDINLDRFEGIVSTIQSYLDIGDSIESRLSQISMPTVIIHGDADSRIPFSCSQKLQNSIPGSELYIIPGAEHGLLSNEPELVRRVMIQFLERVAPKAGIASN